MGRVVYRALTGTNGKTHFAMTAKAGGIGDSGLYQNRTVIPTWLRANPSRS
jgi:hypothetical protein